MTDEDQPELPSKKFLTEVLRCGIPVDDQMDLKNSLGRWKYDLAKLNVVKSLIPGGGPPGPNTLCDDSVVSINKLCNDFGLRLSMQLSALIHHEMKRTVEEFVSSLAASVLELTENQLKLTHAGLNFPKCDWWSSRDESREQVHFITHHLTSILISAMNTTIQSGKVGDMAAICFRDVALEKLTKLETHFLPRAVKCAKKVLNVHKKDLSNLTNLFDVVSKTRQKFNRQKNGEVKKNRNCSPGELKARQLQVLKASIPESHDSLVRLYELPCSVGYQLDRLESDGVSHNALLQWHKIAPPSETDPTQSTLDDNVLSWALQKGNHAKRVAKDAIENVKMAMNMPDDSDVWVSVSVRKECRGDEKRSGVPLHPPRHVDFRSARAMHMFARKGERPPSWKEFTVVSIPALRLLSVVKDLLVSMSLPFECFNTSWLIEFLKKEMEQTREYVHESRLVFLNLLKRLKGSTPSLPSFDERVMEFDDVSASESVLKAVHRSRHTFLSGELSPYAMPTGVGEQLHTDDGSLRFEIDTNMRTLVQGTRMMHARDFTTYAVAVVFARHLQLNNVRQPEISLSTQQIADELRNLFSAFFPAAHPVGDRPRDGLKDIICGVLDDIRDAALKMSANTPRPIAPTDLYCTTSKIKHDCKRIVATNDDDGQMRVILYSVAKRISDLFTKDKALPNATFRTTRKRTSVGRGLKRKRVFPSEEDGEPSEEGGQSSESPSGNAFESDAGSVY